MQSLNPPGVLAVSIDLELDLPERVCLPEEVLCEVTFSLCNLFRQYQLPATWAVTDPAVSAARESLEQANQGHELALLGDATWIGAGVGRTLFARELARRTDDAQQAGLKITTLALRKIEVSEHVDLLIRHGITGVRPDLAEAHRLATLRPAPPIQFGIWQLNPSMCLPGQSRWLPGGGGVRTARRLMDRAIAGSTIAHLGIDAPRLAALKSSGLRALEKVIRHAARQRDAGRLVVETLAQVAGRLSRRPEVVPARSILRGAA